MTARSSVLRFFSLAQSVLFALALIVGAALPVLAEDSQSYEQTVERAVSEFNLGNWEEAHALFRKAHELAPSARSWRGLGVCAFELRHYVEAVGNLEAALLDPRKPLTAEQRENVKALLAQAREFVSAYRLRVTPADAEVMVDGKPATRDGNVLYLDPGPHSVVVRASGYEERRAEFRAGAGTKEELSIELSVHDRDSAEPGQTADPPSASQAPAKQQRARVWTWSLTGAAVAAATAAVALRLRVNGLHSEYERCSAAGAQCQPIRTKSEKLLHASYASAGLTGAFLVGAGIAFALERRDQPSKQVALGLTPDGLQLTGSF
ncbi:MAG: hypothetical protein JWN04_474 [Myxococcaceae bacterium]|nr:hypothetical protein [Myxococcaceae bacterium]